MKVLIYGAGVIGQIYGGRLAQKGHDVTLLAREESAAALASRGVTLRKDGESWHLRPAVVTEIPRDASFDLILVTVRRDQLAPIIDDLSESAGGQVVFMLNQCTDLERVRERVGADRTLFGFPGVAGYRSDDGSITYLEVRQQPNTIERRNGLERQVTDLLRSAGFAVETSEDMAGWLATHAVFVTAVGAAILASDGDSAALAADRARVAELVAAVGEGFRALARQGVTVTPTPLRLIFTVVPRFAAIRYWQAQLRGPVGTIATRDTEFPALRADVRLLVAGHGPTPRLDRLLSDQREPGPGTRLTKF
jgi:2-dehydropantoate 2-reductase